MLDGTLTLMVEGEPQEYAVGDVVRVAPEVRRQLVNRGAAALRLLALGGYVDHEHEPRDAEAFNAWDETEPGTPQTVPLPEDLPAPSAPGSRLAAAAEAAASRPSRAARRRRG